jgi:hypothetical protein
MTRPNHACNSRNSVACVIYSATYTHHFLYPPLTNVAIILVLHIVSYSCSLMNPYGVTEL